MEPHTLLGEVEDQALDDTIKARVEALLADPQCLAWLDQCEDDGTCPF